MSFCISSSDDAARQQGAQYLDVRYLWAIALGLAIVLAPFCLSIAYMSRAVAPRLSDSLSFNQKARWLSSIEGCDVLVIGSSMALNNIDGERIRRAFPGMRVVNAGSWGLSVRDSGLLLRVLADKCRPRYLILPVYFGDFSSEDGMAHDDKAIDWDGVRQSMRGEWSFASIGRLLDFRYMYESFRLLRSREYGGSGHYKSLAFDTTGSVMFSRRRFAIDTARWNGYSVVAKRKVVPANVSSLVRILNDAQELGARTIVVKTPMRPVAMAAFNKSREFSGLWSLVGRAISEQGAVMIDGDEFSLDDSSFVDFCHLNSKGADQVTDAVIVQMRSDAANGSVGR